MDFSSQLSYVRPEARSFPRLFLIFSRLLPGFGLWELPRGYQGDILDFIIYKGKRIVDYENRKNLEEKIKLVKEDRDNAMKYYFMQEEKKDSRIKPLQALVVELIKETQ